ncbi:SusC/RagA family TonB-linked outer membrane protein [Puteibacter caeruleilacunae]|nr:SusC/RagA family TonB-linked outer membrane protein [Puteibacter caeruleilacunae]
MVSLLQATASTYSQNTKLSVNLKSVSIQELLLQLEDQSEFSFVYRSDLFKSENKVDIKVKNQTVEEILNECLVEKGYAYEVTDRTVVISKAKVQQAPKVQTTNQSKTKKVTGVVNDPDGVALPGATVVVVGSSKGVITDLDGAYSIEVESTDKLLFSFIGMESQTIEVGTKKVINVDLKSKTEALDDVTVVAFAKQKKESVVASITTVKPGELKIPTSNLTNAIAGRMSGVISYQRSGEPGADNAEFFIRGVTTFGYKKDPLILIDGVELGTDDLARLQPDDVESFSIMKDASATALYGARGANGVILVTTKQGTEGKAKVSVRLENSLSTPVDKVDIADPITYMKMGNEAVRTRSPLASLPYSYAKIDATTNGENPIVYPAIDWYDEMFKDYTMNQRLNFNVSGGGKVARYYLAGTFNKDNGNLRVDDRNNFNSNINLKRYLLRSNININITKTTEAIVRFYGTFDDYTGPIDGGSDLYGKVMKTNPVLFPKYYPNVGDYANSTKILFGNFEHGNYINPYADMVKGYKDYTKSLMLAQFELKQNFDFITEGLNARFLVNTHRASSFDVKRFYNPFYFAMNYYDKAENKYYLSELNPESGTEYLGYEEGAKNIKSTFYMESAINYNRVFAEKHGVSGMLVFTMRNELMANAGDLQKSLPYRNMGLSGRFTYAYDSRYMLEANFGYNGSERFANDERFGFFPSFGLGWNIANEDFWGNMKSTISKLKLKATYGLVGSDAIGSANDRFFYLSNVNMADENKRYFTGRNFNYSTQIGNGGITVSRYANPLITWEKAKQVNLGVELQLWEKLNIQADVFKENRTNILMDRASIPATMGLQSTPRANVGEALGKGLDMSLDYQQSFNQDFWMSARANFTYAVGEFKVYEEPDYVSAGLPWLSHEGVSLNQKWGFIAERLFIDEADVANSPKQSFDEYGAGDIKYKDLNGDGVITNLDKAPLGKPTSPEIVYGFGASMGYKNFDLSFFFQGSARSSFWIDARAIAPFIDTVGGDTEGDNQVLQVIADNYWSESNRDNYAFWPRLSDTANENNLQTSTWFMRDGDFIRLKSLEFGYSLNKAGIKKIGIDRLRLYLNGTNLLTFSKFKLWDPEMAGNGLGYPIQKVFNIGLQVQF